MNTTASAEELQVSGRQKPGATLAAVRMQKGYGTEYVAGKLHLRVQMIELLESDAYHKMPEPVFVKGYLRAYARLLGVKPDPLIEVFNSICVEERPTEKLIWQTRRVEHRGDHRMVRWVTSLFALGLLIAIGLWWHSARDQHQSLFPGATAREEAVESRESDIRLTDLSRMESLLTAPEVTPSVEQQGE